MKFHRTAPCQMRILEEFQREGWRLRIDDPLPPTPRGNAKQRLHNAINALNRARLIRAIHFRLDAGGAGIEWERIF
jgi:hypothetical protein